MIAATMRRTELLRPVSRFLRTPKGMLTLILAGIATLAIPGEGAAQVAPGLIGAMGAAAAVDVGVARLVRKEWIFPSGALLSGLIIAMVLAPMEPLAVPIATSVLAITSKHLFRTRLANVFNPAALAIVIASVLFDSAQSWWGALPGLGWPGVAVLVAGGMFIADRVNKLPLVIAFLGTYFALFTEASFVGDSVRIAEIFRAPDLHMALYFAFFMLDDPPTCPVRYRHQLEFGVIVAFAAYLIFQVLGVVYFLPAALLFGNLREGWRRRSRQRPVRKPVAPANEWSRPAS